MFAAIVVYALLVLFRLVAPAQWEFSVEAQTQVVELGLAGSAEVRWLVDGALVCTRRGVELPEAYRWTGDGDPCGSRAWQGWRFDGPELVLLLDGAVTATLQVGAQGELAMALRGEDGSDVGTLSLVGSFENRGLGPAVNLLWSGVPAQSLIFPFTGTTTLGRAVSWSGTRLLLAGRVDVFSADESADRRSMVDEAQLMLGDQVRLGPPASGRSWPKGFVRVAQNPRDDPVLEVVAFGWADALRIERYGESGYDFQPGWISKLASDPGIPFWGSLLAAYMTLILSLQPFMEDSTGSAERASRWHRFKLWFRRRPKP